MKANYSYLPLRLLGHRRLGKGLALWANNVALIEKVTIAFFPLPFPYLLQFWHVLIFFPLKAKRKLKI